MSREVCGICWCPYDDDTGECACEPEPKKQHMTTLRTAAQQALEALDEAATFHRNLPDQHARRLAAMTALRAALAEPEERNFCPRCGKRTQDIHTCTPP